MQRNEGAIERHLSTSKVLTTEADQFKRAVEESKIAVEEDSEDLNQWIIQVDTRIFEAHESVTNPRSTIEEFHQEVELKKQQKKLDFEKRLFKAKIILAIPCEGSYSTAFRSMGGREPKLNAQFRKSHYVDDLMSGAPEKPSSGKRQLKSSVMLCLPFINGNPMNLLL